MTQVDIFGTYHIDRPRKVKEELREFSTDAEIFLTEQAKEPASVSEWIELLAWNPAMFISGWCLNFFWGVLGFLLTRRFDSVDGVATKKIAKERGIPIEPVDMDVVREMSDVGALFTACSWIWGLFVVTVLSFGIGVHPAVFIVYGYPASGPFFVLSAYLLGLLPVVAWAKTSLQARDEVMAKNIEQVLDSRDDIERACLVVGHEHADGIANELRDRDFEVDEPFQTEFFRQSL